MLQQVQGKERTIVRDVAKQLELDGSYIPRTYIEQIQLEKLLKEVMVWHFGSVSM
jgi:uridine kinase